MSSPKQRTLELMQAKRLDEAKATCAMACQSDPSDAEAWCLAGVVHGMLGELDESLACCQRAIALRPNYAEAHVVMGRALEDLRRLDEAAAACHEAVRLAPNNADAHFNLGNVLSSLGQPKVAVGCYNEAIRIRPDDAEAHVNLSVAFAASGQFAEAVKAYRRALELQPNSANICNGLGAALAALGHRDEAIAAYHRALSIDPAHALAHNNLGNALTDEGQHEKAIIHYREALRLKPDYAEAHYNLGTALYERGQLKEAALHYREALRLRPDYVAAHNNLGLALAAQGRTDEAILQYQHTLRLKPDYVEAHNNLGNALAALGRRDEAIASYQRAIETNPAYAEAHTNLAFVNLLMGRFKSGWKEYDWQWQREGVSPRPLPLSPWDGSDLAGRGVFLHAEQGLGEELFFLRFVPGLKQRGAGTITYRPTPKIASLLARSAAIDRLAGPGEGPASGELVFSVGDLPRLLGMTCIDQIPPPFTLVPRTEAREVVRAQLTAAGPPPYIGVTWRAGTRGRNALHKEVPLARLAGLLKTLPATILILQRHPAEGEVEALASALGRPAHDLSPLNEDLESMLALLALIDDYVGVSNTNMYLRAGTGKTARVLVPAPPEWRWMAEGKESPWFPGFTIYRQGYDGSWEKAFDMLTSDLQKAFGR
jgi:tetratricopeptide (TPR) repeat protein